MKKLIFVALVSIIHCSLAVAQDSSQDQVQMLELIRQKAGFAAEIPVSVCKQSFPDHKIIPVNLPVNNTTSSFDLFSFTAAAFDPEKPSILFIHGGPGGLWGPTEALANSKLFPDSNVIFFHYRGGGCSHFASNDAELDKFISSDETINDMEAIRNVYGVKKWKSVIGFSYGTDVARRYAKRFPSRIQFLVLEGLNSSFKLSPQQVVSKIMDTIRGRFKVSKDLQSRISAENFEIFLGTLGNYLSQISPEQNFGLAALWEYYEKFYSDYFAAQGIPVPQFFNRNTFLSVTNLMYSGEGDSSDVAILMLMKNFDFGFIPAELVGILENTILGFDKVLFPFRYPDFLSNLSSSGLLSWRVLLTMQENDKMETKDSICSPVDTLVINGTQDLATPVENVDKFLSNKSCASGSNTALLVQGGGHSSLGSMKCLSQFVAHTINGQDSSADLATCEVPVVVKRYEK